MSIRPRLTPAEYQLIQRYRKSNPINTLIIGDIHEPFSLDGYLDHCKAVRDHFGCSRIVFIGDVIDHHYSSFHPTDPDGYGAGEELERAIDKIQQWYEVFPEAIVTVGNHDKIISRKAFASGISRNWIKGYAEVLNTPNWEFVDRFEEDNVLYIHGQGTSGRSGCANRALHMSTNCVQGHIHTESSVIYSGDFWGLQVGCGIDRNHYAFAYAREFPKPIRISCGVVLGNGALPLVIPMGIDLETL
jgi:metallophosphoesterase superfamily enzyme